jgi:hypothetical protein
MRVCVCLYVYVCMSVCVCARVFEQMCVRVVCFCAKMFVWANGVHVTTRFAEPLLHQTLRKSRQHDQHVCNPVHHRLLKC